MTRLLACTRRIADKICAENTPHTVYRVLTPGNAPPYNLAVFKPGQSVHMYLAGLQVGEAMFQAAVTAAVGTIIRQTSEARESIS